MLQKRSKFWSSQFRHCFNTTKIHDYFIFLGALAITNHVICLPKRIFMCKSLFIKTVLLFNFFFLIAREYLKQLYRRPLKKKNAFWKCPDFSEYGIFISTVDFLSCGTQVLNATFENGMRSPPLFQSSFSSFHSVFKACEYKHNKELFPSFDLNPVWSRYLSGNLLWKLKQVHPTAGERT